MPMVDCGSLTKASREERKEEGRSVEKACKASLAEHEVEECERGRITVRQRRSDVANQKVCEA